MGQQATVFGFPNQVAVYRSPHGHFDQLVIDITGNHAFSASSRWAEERTSPLTSPLMMMCGAITSPVISPTSDTRTTASLPSSAMTRPRILPSTCRPPEKCTSPSMVVRDEIRVSNCPVARRGFCFFLPIIYSVLRYLLPVEGAFSL